MIASIQFVVAVDGVTAPVLVGGGLVGVVAVVAVGVVGVVEVVGVVGVTSLVGAGVFGADGLVRCTLGCEATACTWGVLDTALTALTL
jgi:hypothetical protein